MSRAVLDPLPVLVARCMTCFSLWGTTATAWNRRKGCPFCGSHKTRMQLY